jgi:hypothetical protein
MNDQERHAEGEDHIEKVRRRAHAIWLDQGMVHGRDQEHWREAEREIAAEEAERTSPKGVEPAKGAGDVSAKGAGSPVKGAA